jgi:DNA-binding XRE family transcriptional regulator
MIDDPVMKELRKHKAEIAKEYNYDFRLMAESMKKEALEAGIELIDNDSKKVKNGTMKVLEDITGGQLTLRRLLHSIRLGKEMTQVEFAKKLMISKSYLGDVEKGRKNISVKRAASFAKILGLSEEQFIRLALEEQLFSAGLNYKVELKRHRR